MKLSRKAGIACMLGITLALGSMGFQCSSPNITSGKMYYQQYQQSKDPAKLDQALSMFQKEVDEKPNSAEGWYWLGFIHGEKKEYIKLQEAWSKSKSLSPQMQKEITTNTPYYWQQAYNQGLMTAKKAQIKKDKALFAEATESVKAATLLWPDSSAKYGAYGTFAMLLMNQGKLQEAVAPLNEQIQKAPNPTAYQYLGDLYLAFGDEAKTKKNDAEAKKNYDLAIKTLEDARVQFPDNSEIYQSLITGYIKVGRAAEKAGEMKNFADANPKDKAAQYVFGTLSLEMKDYEKAAEYLEKAVTLDGKYENALYNLSVAYLRWGSRIQEEGNQSKDGLTDAQSAKMKDLYAKAVSPTRKLLELKPNEIQYVDLAVKVFLKANMMKESDEMDKKLSKLRQGS